ncbi:succinate dehydrogenase assembly factor 2 [Granulosicoccus antarcticus]|uniref:FAD assembly factor SdhE n=1 Tax=Granulosicoccus antarcticus IMCC3135 TaxID=1192854 RepID=A0A2Z2NZ14_9GAMM|nr:succinate dehydrogenase assembly factor 2 [Granulosicoccus antarcticus]ASJ72374.1 Antitoxin CptB [Granulosicoccus antarcticus IMCC3135]
MNVEAEKLSKLRWRCRRGMRELDQAMRAYLDDHYVAASADEQALFEELQDLQDPDLFKLISGKAKEARYQIILDKMSFTLASRT